MVCAGVLGATRTPAVSVPSWLPLHCPGPTRRAPDSLPHPLSVTTWACSMHKGNVFTAERQRARAGMKLYCRKEVSLTATWTQKKK